MKTVALVEGRNQLSSTFWLTTREGDLVAQLSEPSEGGRIPVRRIKSTVLEGGPQKPKSWNFGADRAAASATMLQVFEAYVTEIVRQAKETRGPVDQLWFTIPAVKDSAVRLDYHRALKQAAALASDGAEAGFITEPDAVLQYFRLVDKRIEQSPGALEVYLVLDAGAGTTNISVVFKGKTLEGVGKLREDYTSRGALQPVFAEASNIAGDWIDERIPELFLQKARSVGISRMDAGDALLRSLVEKDAERIKVALSAGRTSWVVKLPAGIGGKVRDVAITRADLASVVGELTSRVEQLLEGVLASAFKQLYGNSVYRPELEERGVTSAEQFPRMLKYVILAGGSSQLPGFTGRIKSKLGLAISHGAELIEVGELYSFPVAFGLAAHALEQRPRLMKAVEAGSRSAEGEPTPEPERIHRLIADVSLVYCRSKSPSARQRKLFDSNAFPLAYPVTVEPAQTELVGPHAKRIKLPVDRAKSSQQMRFALAHLNESETDQVSPDDSALLMLENNAFWFEIDQNDRQTLPKQLLAVPSFDVQAEALVVDLFEYIRPGTDNRRPRHIKRLRHFLHQQELARIAESGPARRSASKEPAPQPDAIMEGPPPLAFDIGTSKCICVAGELPLDALLSHDGSPLDLGEHTGPPLPDLPKPAPATEAPQGGLDEDEDEPASTDPDSGEEVELEPPAPAPLSDPEETPSPELTNQGPTADVAPDEPKPTLGDTSSESSEDATSTAPLPTPPDPAPSMPPAPSQLTWKPSERELLDYAHAQLLQVGLQLDYADLVNLHICMKVSPLTLLAGPPGVGKTALARLYSMALGARDDLKSLTRVAIQAHWTRPSQLLGVEHGQTRQSSRFLELALRADERKEELFFVILDEFNLAQADYYLSEILSAMSDDGRILCPDQEGGTFESRHLPIVAPDHRLFLLGTMNIDEAATSLTDKVLDRANLIELEPPEVPEQIRRHLDLGKLEETRRIEACTWQGYCGLGAVLDVPDEIALLARILRGECDAQGEAFTTEDQRPEATSALGMRCLRDMVTYMDFAERLYSEAEVSEGVVAEAQPGSADRVFRFEDALDFQVHQRVLPRLHGGNEHEKLLKDLETFCRNHRLIRSTARVKRMRAQLVRHLSFSFWVS